MVFLQTTQMKKLFNRATEGLGQSKGRHGGWHLFSNLNAADTGAGKSGPLGQFLLGPSPFLTELFDVVAKPRFFF